MPRLLLSVAEDMRQLDKAIQDNLASDVVLIQQIATYIIAAGGKRIRPALLLGCARALGYEHTDSHTLAAVVEFIHTATLLHDDVVDESSMRRGKKTANALFGNAASVLVGDFLYSRAFQMMVEVDDMRVMRILSDATNTIAEGEVLQLMNLNDASMNEARYLKVVEYKTATLFKAATQLGAVLACAEPAVEAALSEYGYRLGLAFQLMDDWLDYAGSTETMGKNVGDDLREGKLTLPLIYLLTQGMPAEQAMVRSVAEGNPQNFDLILDVIKNSGALAYTQKRAQEEVEKAAVAISILPKSSYQEALLELCEYVVARHS